MGLFTPILQILTLLFLSLTCACTATPPTINIGQPIVVAVAPAKVPTTGGTMILLAGTGFDSGTTVTVDGQTCADPQIQSSTTLLCVTPPHAVATVDVKVTNANSRTDTLSQQLSFYNPASRAVAGRATVASGGIVSAPGYQLEFSVGGSMPSRSAPTGNGFQELAGLLGVLYGP